MAQVQLVCLGCGATFALLRRDSDRVERIACTSSERPVRYWRYTVDGNEIHACSRPGSRIVPARDLPMYRSRPPE